MTRKRSKKQKLKVSDLNSRYRKLMRYVEPKVFYEDNYFSPHGESADTWRVCWLAEKGLFLLFLAAAWFGVWWALPLLFPSVAFLGGQSLHRWKSRQRLSRAGSR